MIVADTEHAHLIPRNAHGQRAGVLGVLSDLGETLRLLPERDDCAAHISLSEWASERKGWIFITSTTDSREALRPLQAVFINLLMKRLMSVSPEWGQAHPCWLVVDEVHSLHRLPALYEAETEGRKYVVLIDPDGNLRDKAQDVKDIESGALSAGTWEVGDLKVHVLDKDAAFVSAVLWLKTESTPCLMASQSTSVVSIGSSTRLPGETLVAGASVRVKQPTGAGAAPAAKTSPAEKKPAAPPPPAPKPTY